jgi:hypothetical protein
MNDRRSFDHLVGAQQNGLRGADDGLAAGDAEIHGVHPKGFRVSAVDRGRIYAVFLGGGGRRCQSAAGLGCGAISHFPIADPIGVIARVEPDDDSDVCISVSEKRSGAPHALGLSVASLSAATLMALPRHTKSVPIQPSIHRPGSSRSRSIA